jgi:hypothetical protein
MKTLRSTSLHLVTRRFQSLNNRPKLTAISKIAMDESNPDG